MSYTVEDIQLALNNQDADKAIDIANNLIAIKEAPLDRIYYLLGNAHRKKGDWQNAINNYLEAIAINPESPAKEAYMMANDILDFFNKDMYNQ